MEHYHTKLLNLIAGKINAEHYLEIGIFNPDHNFNLIKCPYKIGVDPDPNANATVRATSDEFFASNTLTFDLIWLDGLHHADQLRKDLLNAWKCLNPGGVIAIHDSNPHSEKITHVPRDNREWTGDIYQTVANIRSDKFTVNEDYGCCVIRKLNKIGSKQIYIQNKEITWEYFDQNRQELLNLVTVEKAHEIIEGWGSVKAFL
jgi:SAM-dependent methyltransferase